MPEFKVGDRVRIVGNPEMSGYIRDVRGTPSQYHVEGDAFDGWYLASGIILDWSRTPPTEPGWYWYLDESITGVDAVRVYDCGEYLSCENYGMVSELSGQWLPLETPELPKDKT